LPEKLGGALEKKRKRGEKNPPSFREWEKKGGKGISRCPCRREKGRGGHISLKERERRKKIGDMLSKRICNEEYLNLSLLERKKREKEEAADATFKT